MPKERAGEQRDTTPARIPETTPLPYPGPDYSFTLQAIMEMQKTLGQVTQSVATFSDQIKKHDEKLDKISHKVYAAEVVLILVGGILSIVGSGLYFLLVKIWEVVSPLIKVSVGR